jgi:hypothetical protein
MTTQMQSAIAATLSKTVDAPVKSTEITPKKIDIDFNRPLREHLDRAAVRRGWEAYKVAFKKAR